MIDLLIAMNEKEKMVTAARNLCRKKLYYCPACKSRTYLKIGKVMRPHFAHYRKEACAVFSEGETEEHLQGKLDLANYLNLYADTVQLEAYLEELQQRPDILFEKGQRKVVVEFQCSAIPIDKLVERTKGYLNANYEVIWVLGNHFKYTTQLTALHKACLSFNKSENILLFHYDTSCRKLSLRYNFLLNTKGQMHHQTKIFAIDQNGELLIDFEKTHNQLSKKQPSIKQQHWQLQRQLQYPSVKVREFLALLYRNHENIIFMPTVLYLSTPSEWMIQTYHMTWKYYFILWIENYPQKKILTLKMLERWLEEKIKVGKIIYYESPQIPKKEKLRPFLEFIALLESEKTLKEISHLKWSYQNKLKRYRNLEEKFN